MRHEGEAVLHRLAEHESRHVSNRASIILLSLSGRTPSEIAGEVGVSESTVRKWQRAWEADGLGIFPEIDDMPAEEPPDQAGESAPSWQELLVFPEHLPLLPSDSMAEAGRKILIQQLEAMLRHEQIAREGTDIEGVHKMRVATRRTRSAYLTLDGYFPKSYVRKIQKPLRQTARVLGRVRDLDVFLDKTRNYADEHLGADLTPLEPVLAILADRQEKQRRKLIKWLDSKHYRRFVQRYFKVLGTVQPQQGDVTTHVAYVLPIMIYERWGAVRAYGGQLEGAEIATLHALRIEFKRLRYTLEFFAEVLGDPAQMVIKEVKGMQDHLGDMNDAEVAVKLLGDIEKAIPPTQRAGMMAYRQYRQAEMERLVETFPQVWEEFYRRDIREALALAVAAL